MLEPVPVCHDKEIVCSDVYRDLITGLALLEDAVQAARDICWLEGTLLSLKSLVHNLTQIELRPGLGRGDFRNISHQLVVVLLLGLMLPAVGTSLGPADLIDLLKRFDDITLEA